MRQQHALVNVVCDEWGWRHRPVSEITRREISEQLRGMIGPDGKRAIRANRVHAVLHKMFRWSAGQGYLDSHPMADMGKPSPERVRDRVLSDDEVRALWTACHKWRRGAHLHPMAGAVLLALLTGQRMGECVGLHRDEVGADGVWRLPAARVKNKHAHIVPLPKSALQLLQAMPQGVPLPFGGKPVGTQQKVVLDRHVKAELGETCRPFRLHDIRRTVRSGLAAAGVSWEVQHRVQNHLSPLGAMDRIYQRHDYSAELRAALEAWESRLMGIVRPLRAVV
jgi:integrase